MDVGLKLIFASVQINYQQLFNDLARENFMLYYDFHSVLVVNYISALFEVQTFTTNELRRQRY